MGIHPEVDAVDTGRVVEMHSGTTNPVTQDEWSNMHPEIDTVDQDERLNMHPEIDTVDARRVVEHAP